MHTEPTMLKQTTPEKKQRKPRVLKEKKKGSPKRNQNRVRWRNRRNSLRVVGTTQAGSKENPGTISSKTW